MTDIRPDSENAARAELLAVARSLAACGLNPARAGNVSLRWARSGGDGLLVTPSALDYATMGIDDIVWVPLLAPPAGAGDDALAPPPRWSGRRRPSSEWRLHHDVLRARPEIGAVVHAHAPFAATLACLDHVQREGIPPFHYMVAVAGGHTIPCAPYAPFGSTRLSQATVAALREHRACLLASHGLVACGASLADARELAVELEWLSQLYWQALQAGGPTLLDAAQMDEVLARFAQYRGASDDPSDGPDGEDAPASRA